MRRWAAASLLFCTGCSNAPLAGFLDLVHPSRIPPTIDRPFDDGLKPLAPSSPLPPLPGGRLLPPEGTSPAIPRPPMTPAPFAPIPPAEPGAIAPLKLPNT